MKQLRVFKNFMIVIDIISEYNPEFFNLIPIQVAYVNKLMNQGVLTTYTLSADRTKLWATMLGETKSDVQDIFEQFPMRKYMDAKIYELAFHNNISHRMPELSMN